MKPKVMMTEWELYVFEARYTLSGQADYHPAMGKNVWVQRASSLENCKLEEDILYYETQNTLYVCPLKYMSRKPYKDVIKPYLKELSKLSEESDGILERIVSATACMALGKKNSMADHIMKLQEIGQQELCEKEKKEQQRLFDETKEYENCIYIEMDDVDSGGKMVYHMGDRFGKIAPQVHVGMFQDSVLYLDYEESIDFRYFPNGLFNSMKTYSCSDQIERVIIKNVTEAPLSFNDEKIEVDETRTFEMKKGNE